MMSDRTFWFSSDFFIFSPELKDNEVLDEPGRRLVEGFFVLRRSFKTENLQGSHREKDFTIDQAGKIQVNRNRRERSNV